ncbi:unnamed protein product [Notodromas monacha]|uniref:Gastric intrinsic factor n=1 Tax=Notodromas monacha TaxID=399045 RepID=A0A7R9GFD9_9CRUS|nr:unnamed protein product [Notodromas monacha]CAG0919041.1 unnamed protein product [Notodromas monacha]
MFGKPVDLDDALQSQAWGSMTVAILMDELKVKSEAVSSWCVVSETRCWETWFAKRSLEGLLFFEEPAVCWLGSRSTVLWDLVIVKWPPDSGSLLALFFFVVKTLNLDFITNRNFSAFSRTRIMYAACVGGIPIPARSVQELLNEVAAYPNNIHTYDTVAQVAMLLQCVLKNAESESVAEAVSGILDDLVLNLTKAADNLNFLSDTSVSLIVQALMCVPDREGHKAALLEPFQKRMLQNQKADGAYDDNVLTTAHILTGLARVCLLDLRSQHCDFNGDTPTEPPGFDVDRGNETVVLVSANFTIWIGLTVELAYSKIVTLRENSTMYQLMRIAAENDPRFEFAAYDFPWGRYIHNIGGIELQHEGYHYWLMYTLPFPPDPKNPPPTSFIGADGVDDLVIKDGMNILFWNKPI